MGTNTGIGIGIGIPFKNNTLGGDRPYLPPELKARLIGVWDSYGKKNTDTDRNIIKNKIPNAGGDLEILNAAYKLNSGFGEYKEDFTSWSKVAGTSIITDSKYVLTDEKAITNAGYFLWNRLAKDSFKVKISNIPNGGWMSYRYRIAEEDTQFSSLFIREDGIYTLPATVAGSDIDFFISKVSAPAKDWVGLTIEQIPSFEGAFVTDGVNDLITSTKTVSEMGIADEITIVSMIHQVKFGSSASITNDIRVGTTSTSSSNGRNAVSSENKTGIYGWSRGKSTPNLITGILGDKNDYSVSGEPQTNYNNKFSVVGTADNRYNSSVAWYWTFIANRVLTTDEINQVIAYYNLDRTLKPDILCSVIKQGITNENHAEFGNKLIDYSGNGRDIQLNNIAWKGGSGIAAKKFETIKDYSIIPDEGTQELTIYNEFSYKIKSNMKDRYWTVQTLNRTDVSYPITIVSDKDIIWRNTLTYNDENGVKGGIRKETNVPANTPTQVQVLGFNDFDVPDNYTKVNCVAYSTRVDITEFTVTFIPSYEGGLLLDGVNDFGKVTGMPIYKDYTVVAKYQRLTQQFVNGIGSTCPISKSYKGSQGAFIMDAGNVSFVKTQCYSFGVLSPVLTIDNSNLEFHYQTKYIFDSQNIVSGDGVDGDTMWLGTFRDNDARFFNGAIYSLMSFPYSMSEFLIERQLKKHKLGTLYPDMVEFRPVIKSNLPYSSISYSVNPGEYISVDSMVTITVTLPNTSDKLMGVSCNAISDISISGDNGVYEITGKVVKSPQKINLVISSYLTMLSNSTLISNETLIKNE